MRFGHYTAVAIVAFFCLSLTAAAADKPNIVLMMADDQGWGDVAYNGHKHLVTPNLDAMAADGLRLDRFYAAAPVCTPTRASVMTGRHPNRMGAFKWGHTLRPQEVTVAEALKKVGYTTGHFGKWHLGSVRKGSPVNPGNSGFDEWLSAENFYDNDPVLSNKGTAVEIQGESSAIAADAAIKFMRQAVANDKHFLAVVWFGSPHDPHRAVDEDRSHYASLPARNQHFLGEVTGIDRAVGKLQAELDKLKIRENTIFWYLSDNGALPGVGSTGGHRGHKGSVYEGGLLVPSIIQWPAKIKKSRNSNVRCNTSDIYPTLLAIAGVKIDKQPPLDGVSLVGLIQGTTTKRTKPMGFWDYPAGGVSTPSDAWMRELLASQKKGQEPADKSKLRLDAGKIKKQYSAESLPGHAAWIDGDWKLHRISGGKGRKGKRRSAAGDDSKRSAKYELYNLAQDRQEKDNVIGDESERAGTMKKALAAWQQSVVGSLNGEDY